ncbi:ABC transporter ATP-binding protein [Myxococcota bacterium]
MVAVLGPNGAGKSTLLRCIDCVLPHSIGSVLIDEDDVRRLSRIEVARRVGYVPQRSETSRLTAFDAILLGRYPCMQRGRSHADVAAVQSIIARLHMEELALRYIDKMSGGELQKVCLARALVQEPRLLLLDEPTSSLDLKNQIETLTLVRAIVNGHDVSAVMSLHDINMAIHYADTVVFMKNGLVHSVCTKSEITERIIEEVYEVRVVLHRTANYPIVVPIQCIKEQENSSDGLDCNRQSG